MAMLPMLHFESGHTRIRVHAQEIDPTQGAGKRAALLLLHGASGHAEFWTSRLAPFLAEGGIHLYAPQYFDRTATVRADLSMLTDGLHVPQWLETVDDALRFVAGRPCVDPERVIVGGISLGGFLAVALAARLSSSGSAAERERIRALLDVSGGLAEPFVALATRSMPPTLIIHGASDNIVPVAFAHSLHQKLTQLGVPHHTEILAGEGHWFSPSSVPRLLLAVSSFLQRHL